MADQTISFLFEKAPAQWGLRADPLLWNDLALAIGALPLPETEGIFSDLFACTFEGLVGNPLDHQENIYVEKYALGGMSSGYVCLAFWREIAYPMLKARYVEANRITHHTSRQEGQV